jgi:hypothetical protein
MKRERGSGGEVREGSREGERKRAEGIWRERDTQRERERERERDGRDRGGEREREREED